MRTATAALAPVRLLPPAWAPVPSHPGCVIYAMQTEDCPYLKIGLSTDLASRLSAIRHATPGGLRLVGWWPVPPADIARKHEMKFHAQLARWRLNGEWFRATDESIAVVEGWIREGGLR